MTRKHFKELAKILGENNADEELIDDIISFCASQNQYFQKGIFVDAVEKNRKELKCQI